MPLRLELLTFQAKGRFYRVPIELAQWMNQPYSNQAVYENHCTPFGGNAILPRNFPIPVQKNARKLGIIAATTKFRPNLSLHKLSHTKEVS